MGAIIARVRERRERACQRRYLEMMIEVERRRAAEALEDAKAYIASVNAELGKPEGWPFVEDPKPAPVIQKPARRRPDFVGWFLTFVIVAVGFVLMKMTLEMLWPR